MGTNSKISWTNDTWNPWTGCEKISPGCKNCYMYRDKKRYGQNPKKIFRSKTTFKAPYKLNGPLVFTCSYSDFFIPAADEWRAEAWEIIKATPHLTYQILTKRPENIKDRLPSNWGDGYPNVWLGVSVESQEYVPRIWELAKLPASLRFVSYEPALGPLNLITELVLQMVDWVIGGGESGPKARAADPEWFHRIQHQCSICEIPYFHKQNGGNTKIAGEWGGNLLQGLKYQEIPEIKNA